MNYSRRAGVEAVAGTAHLQPLQRYQKEQPQQHSNQHQVLNVVNQFFTSGFPNSNNNLVDNYLNHYPSTSALPSLITKNLLAFNGKSTTAFQDNDDQQRQQQQLLQQQQQQQQQQLLLNRQQQIHLEPHQTTSSFHSVPLSLLKPFITTASDKQQQQQEFQPQHLLLSSTNPYSPSSYSLETISSSSTTSSQQQQQSFSEWWSEYWSRQPFPSGYTQSSITLLACLITTIIFLIVVGNLLVCIAIFTEKSLKPTQNWFIASLAVSDMLLGLVVMPFSLARELMGFWIFGTLWCDIHEAIDVLLTTASINTLCLISLDRYWSITQAVSYLKKRTPRRGAFMIAFVWILSAAVSLPPLFGWKKQSPTIPATNLNLTNSISNNNNNNNNNSNNNNTASNTDNSNSISRSNNDRSSSSEIGENFNNNNNDNFETTNSPRTKYGDSTGSAFEDQGGSGGEPSEFVETSESTQQESAKKRRNAQQHKVMLTRERDQLATPLFIGRRSSSEPNEFIENYSKQTNENENNQLINPSQKPSKIRRESNDHNNYNYNNYQQRLIEHHHKNYNNQQSPNNQIDQYISSSSSSGSGSSSGSSSSLTHLSHISATTSTPITIQTTTTASPSFDQNNGYPSCQLTDDVGYVLYSALGSFFIPCAVMVFTYIKIFLAARSRARRAINKQSRAQGGANKRLAARRQVNTFSGHPQQQSNAAGGAGGGQQVVNDLSCVSGAQMTANNNCSANSKAINMCPNTFQQQQQQQQQGVATKPVEAQKLSQDVPIMKGKIVIVERKKSLAASSLAPTSISAISGDSTTAYQGVVCEGGGNSIKLSRTHKESGAVAGSGGDFVQVSANKRKISNNVEDNEEDEDEDNEDNNNEEDEEEDEDDGSQEQQPCTLTTSAAKQASQSALNSSTSNDSSMITVMNASMSKVPITRFSFQGPATRVEGEGQSHHNKEEQRQQQEKCEQDKAAALLKAISQAGGTAADDHLLQEVMSAASDGEHVPDVLVERRQTTIVSCNDNKNNQVVAKKDNIKLSSDELMDDNSNNNNRNRNINNDQLMANQTVTTNETCFMTIEEDSDMFDAQAGRTIMMIAGNASQKQATNLGCAKGSQNIMMTMMPPAGTQSAATTTTSGGNNQQQQQQTIVCNNVLCRQRQHQQQQLQQSPNPARSASSYCGSSMTINDDDMDECVDDDMLTDDCNGYSISCTLDHYECPGAVGSSCVHCHECEQEQMSSPNRHVSSLNDSPQSIGGLCRQHHHHQQQQQHQQRPQQTDNQQQLHRQSQQHSQQKRRHQQQLASSRDATNSGDVDDRLSLTNLDDNGSHITEYRSNEDLSSSIIGHDVLDATEVTIKSDKKRSTNKYGAGTNVVDERKKSLIGFRLTRLNSAAPLSNQSGGLLALASSQSQQASSAASGTRNLKALRQNFFLKLNQLTAKSSSTKHEKDKKSDPSSVQSSGTDHDASVDCATTSHVHSAEYNQDTTGGDEDEYAPQSSGETMGAERLDEQSNISGIVQDKLEVSGQLGQVVKGSSRLMEAFPQSGNNNNSNNNNNSSKNNQIMAFKSDDRALLLRNTQNRDANSRKLLNTNSMIVTSTNGKSHQQMLNGQDQQSLVSTKTKGSPNSNQLNHSLTIVNSASGGNTGVGSGTSRAYLASDNERHKRKLAKARERRATLILGLIMAAFICSWMPFFTFYVLRAVCTVCREYAPQRFEAFVFWMGYCNSAINPIIYTIFNRDFRKAFRKILFKCI